MSMAASSSFSDSSLGVLESFPFLFVFFLTSLQMSPSINFACLSQTALLISYRETN